MGGRVTRSAFLLILTCCFLPGCVNTGTRKPLMVEGLLAQARRDAEALAQAGDWYGARRISDLVLRAVPEDEAMSALRASTPEPVAALLEPSHVGSNRARRLPVERPLWQRIALYLPDRLLDLCDVVSFDLAFGIGLFADVHVTRAAQLGAGARTSLGLGWHEGRSLGRLLLAESGMSYLGQDVQAFGGGTSDVFGIGRLDGMHSPLDPLYQDWRDYWAVGAGAHLVFLGVSVDVHPLQLADFVAGLVGLDWLDDDMARTRATPSLGRERARLMIALQELLRDEQGLARWRAHRDERAASAAE